MFDGFKNVHSPYEVVKTVGFDLETTSETGEPQKFKMRIDVVRILGDDDLAPMIWQVADVIGDVLMLHTAPAATTIRGSSPEEVVAAVLRSFEADPKPPAGVEGDGENRTP